MAKRRKVDSYVERPTPARVRESRRKEHVCRLWILKGDSIVRREDPLSIPRKDAHVEKIRICLGDVDAKHRPVGVADI